MSSATLQRTDLSFPRLKTREASRPSWVEQRLGFRNTLVLWQTRARQRSRLLELDDRLLRDIGVSRDFAEREGRKPFWKA